MSERLRLLIAESNGFSAEAIRLLEDHYVVEQQDLDRQRLLASVGDADVLWVRLRHMIDAEIMDAATDLEVIATNTTGLNHIDLEEADRRGIQVVSLKGEVDFLDSIRATAEHTIALTLALLRRIPDAHQHVCDGYWDRGQFQGSEIHEKTVGVIGYGRLGRIVAGYFESFGARVIVHSRDILAGTSIDGRQAVILDELLRQSDIVSLHASYEPDNDRMIGAVQFACMKPGAVFVNTARGELVDEEALVTVLREHRIAGAALDVIRDEQKEDGASVAIRDLAQQSSVLLTPHIGGNTRESLEKTEVFLAEQLCAMAQADRLQLTSGCAEKDDTN